jgi:hypothetical protein
VKFALDLPVVDTRGAKECILRETLLRVKELFKKHSVVQGVDNGYLWWLKHLDANGVRYNGKAAQGNGGQKIFVWQEQNLVGVTTRWELQHTISL